MYMQSNALPLNWANSCTIFCCSSDGSFGTRTCSFAANASTSFASREWSSIIRCPNALTSSRAACVVAVIPAATSNRAPSLVLFRNSRSCEFSRWWWLLWWFVPCAPAAGMPAIAPIAVQTAAAITAPFRPRMKVLLVGGGEDCPCERGVNGRAIRSFGATIKSQRPPLREAPTIRAKRGGLLRSAGVGAAISVLSAARSGTDGTRDERIDCGEDDRPPGAVPARAGRCALHREHAREDAPEAGRGGHRRAVARRLRGAP